MYTYDLEEIVKQLRKKKYKKILVQLPEGMRLHALQILDFFSSKNLTPAYYLEPSFGACDLIDYKIKNLNFDCILHFGHTQMVKSQIPIIYVPVQVSSEPQKLADLINTFLSEKKIKKISLAASAQYLHLIPKIKEKLKTKVINSKPKITKPNQVLGCDFTVLSPKAQINILLSDSLFHAQGAFFYSKKPTYLLDIVEERIIDIQKEKEKFLRQRIIAVSKAKEADVFGILLTTKPGQSKPKQAEQAEKFLKKKGKKTYLLIADKINTQDLLSLKIDCLVNTACPRIAIDDFLHYNIPIINYSELKFIDNIGELL